MGAWDAWIGREDTRTDTVEAPVVARWLATFDRVALADGKVPQGFHWCLCLPDAPTERLGEDGHPVRESSADSFLPPVPLPRRMWAASRVEFVTPLRVGETITRRSHIQSIAEKSGTSGPLVFVDVMHELAGEAGVAVREVQSIVYREAAAVGAPLSPPVARGKAFDPGDWERFKMLVPDSRLLFRYSALTFNSHRIHYDLPYAQDTERYRGLVVHGPLLATLLLDIASSEFGDNALETFEYRGLSPAICNDDLHLVMQTKGDAVDFAAFAGDGRQLLTASGRMKD